MKTDPTSTVERTDSAGTEGAAARRSRGSYRRQLTAGATTLGVEAKRAAAVILEVLAGLRTPTGAAAALGIRLPRYYVLEQRAIEGLVRACEPRAKGRTVGPERHVARLERELATARRDLATQQALTRSAQRALGLTLSVTPPPRAASNAATKSSVSPTGKTRRRTRKPSVRALRAARFLNLNATDSPGAESCSTVQTGTTLPAAPGVANESL